jgi:hypothetical protein
MDRSPNAPLSPQELASLRRLAGDQRQPIPGSHRQLLASMRLVRLTAGALIVTEEGRRRLLKEPTHSPALERNQLLAER